MTKPIHTNLTQEQRNTCVAAAVKSGAKLNEWAGRVLLSAAKAELSRCDKCGKADFDSSKGCKTPSIFSAGTGDWVCNEAGND